MAGLAAESDPRPTRAGGGEARPPRHVASSLPTSTSGLPSARQAGAGGRRGPGRAAPRAEGALRGPGTHREVGEPPRADRHGGPGLPRGRDELVSHCCYTNSANRRGRKRPRRRRRGRPNRGRGPARGSGRPRRSAHPRACPASPPRSTIICQNREGGVHQHTERRSTDKRGRRGGAPAPAPVPPPRSGSRAALARRPGRTAGGRAARAPGPPGLDPLARGGRQARGRGGHLGILLLRLEA